jgi:hypothetical protein
VVENEQPSWISRRYNAARTGIEQNFWWLLAFAIGALAWGWLKDGDVPAWVLGAAVFVAAVLLAMVTTSLLRRIEHTRGERDEARRDRDEARQQRDESQQRLAEAQHRAAGSVDVDLPASPAARSLVRRIRNLREDLENSAASGTPTRGRGDTTSDDETGQVAALIRETEALVGTNETVVAAKAIWANGYSHKRFLEGAIMTLGQLEGLVMDYTEPPGPMGSMS